MNKLGRILVCCGILFGLIALASNEGAFACITSIAALAVGALLLQEAERPLVLPLVMKVIQQSKQSQP